MDDQIQTNPDGEENEEIGPMDGQIQASSDGEVNEEIEPNELEIDAMDIGLKKMQMTIM